MLAFDVWEVSKHYNQYTHFLSFLKPNNVISGQQPLREMIIHTKSMMDKVDFPTSVLHDTEYGMNTWFWTLSSEQYLEWGYDSVLAEMPAILSLSNLHFHAVYSAAHDISRAQVKDTVLTPILQKFYLKDSNALGILIFLNRLDDYSNSTMLRFSLDLILLFDAEQPLKSSLIKTILIPQDYNTCYLCSLKITTISNDNWHWHRTLYNQFWHNTNVMMGTCNFIHSVHYNYGKMQRISPTKYTLISNYVYLDDLLSDQLSIDFFTWFYYAPYTSFYTGEDSLKEDLKTASTMFAVMVPDDPCSLFPKYWRIFQWQPERVVELINTKSQI